MAREYVTADHLDAVLERVAVSHDRIDQLRERAAAAAHAEHERARQGGETQEGGNT